MRHKHADLIHAWAEGAEIQIKHYDEWFDHKHPTFGVTCEYRLKPEPKPYVVQHWWMGPFSHMSLNESDSRANLRITIDGETGKIKKAEII